MPSWIDGALYPDVDPPIEIQTLSERVDFVARLCSTWDFGLLPDAETAAEVRRPIWRQAVDACRLLTLPAYHLLRVGTTYRNCPISGKSWPTFGTIRT